MSPGDVALAALPQADGRTKPRPVLLLRQMPPHADWLVCGISSQLHQRVPAFDEILALGDADYVSSGVKVPSLIRLGFLAVLPVTDITGRIGSVSHERLRRLLTNLSRHLTGAVS